MQGTDSNIMEAAFFMRVGQMTDFNIVNWIMLIVGVILLTIYGNISHLNLDHSLVKSVCKGLTLVFFVVSAYAK